MTEPFGSIIVKGGLPTAPLPSRKQDVMTDTPEQTADVARAPALTDALRADASRSVVTQQGAPPARGMDGEVLPPRRKRPRLIVWVLLAAAAGGAGWYGTDWWTHGRFLVSTDDAYVKADVTTVAAKVAGYVTAVPVANNTRVKAGDVVARIDDGDYKLAVEAAKGRIATQQATIARIRDQEQAQDAAIGQAQAQLAATQADATRAEADFQRAQQLAQSDFGSKQRLDAARADRDRTLANVKSAEASIESARAAKQVIGGQATEAEQTLKELQTTLERAERDLAFTTVVAPVDGVVANRAAEVGNFVQAGTRLAAVVPLSSVYVEANFKETQLGRLQPGQKVDVEVDALPGHAIEGTVQSFAPGSGSIFSLLPPDNATGNFTKIVQRVPVRIQLPGDAVEKGQLRPGLSVVATVHTRTEDETASPSVVGRLVDTIRRAVGAEPAKAGAPAAVETAGASPAS